MTAFRIGLAAGLCVVLGAAAAPAAALETELAAGADLAMVLDLEAKMADSMQFGHAVPVVFDSPEQLPGHVVAAPYWGDSGLWTGVYLGGQAMRLAPAQHHLASAAGRAPSGRQQRDQALRAGARRSLAAEHRDINIAEDWTGTLRSCRRTSTPTTRPAPTSSTSAAASSRASAA